MKYLSVLLLVWSINLSAEPLKIVALAPHITEMLFAIGAGDEVVAVSDYSDYPEAAVSIPRVANFASINIEAVLALQPDVVIGWQSGNPPEDLKRLKQFGINVVMSDPLTLADIAKELRMLGELTHHQVQAEQQALQFEQQLSAMQQQYKAAKSIKVFFAMGTTPLSTVANKAWPQQILTLCGADNPFAEVKGDYPQVGIEQVVDSQPDVIIQAAGGNIKPDFSYWRKFSAIPAVKQQQYLAVNADFLYRTTPRTLLGIQQVCHGLDAFR